jgi:hypothetical protein
VRNDDSQRTTVTTLFCSTVCVHLLTPLFSLVLPLSFFSACVSRTISAENAPALILEYEVIRRNKRCALAVLNERIARVKSQWWETNGVLPRQEEGEVRANMAPHEVRFFEGQLHNHTTDTVTVTLPSLSSAHPLVTLSPSSPLPLFTDSPSCVCAPVLRVQHVDHCLHR